MREGQTFSMKEARGRYVISATLTFFFLVTALYLPFFLLLACALQGVLFRLSRPAFLAFLPTLAGAILSLVIMPNPLSLLPALLTALIGIILRVVQIKRMGKDAALLWPALVIALVLALLFLFMLDIRYGEISLDAVYSFGGDVKTETMAMLEEYLDGSGRLIDAQMRAELLDTFESTMKTAVLILPSILLIFLFVISYLIYSFYRLACRLMRMKDGLPEKGWHMTLSLPFAAFYLVIFFIMVIMFFFGGNDILAITIINLTLCLTFVIALIGARALSQALSLFFIRVSPRVILAITLILLSFSSFFSFLWPLLALVYAGCVVMKAFKKRDSGNGV